MIIHDTINTIYNNNNNGGTNTNNNGSNTNNNGTFMKMILLMTMILFIIF